MTDTDYTYSTKIQSGQKEMHAFIVKEIWSQYLKNLQELGTEWKNENI